MIIGIAYDVGILVMIFSSVITNSLEYKADLKPEIYACKGIKTPFFTKIHV